MGAKLGRRFLKQPAEKLKAVFVATSTRMFIKMAVLHCTSISELCSAINSTVATVHENFTSQQR